MNIQFGFAALLACATLSMGACKKDDKSDKAAKADPAETAKKVTTPDKGATPEAPKELTAADFTASLSKGWAAFNAGDLEGFAALYADDAIFELVDSGQPPAEGKEAVVANVQAWRAAFPDMKGEGVHIFASGNMVVSVDLMAGTNSGDFMGMPATNKAIGMLVGHAFEMNAAGKVQKEWIFMDQGTMMGQLGVHEMPHRPLMTPTGSNATPVIAANNDKEKANLEAHNTMIALSNERKMDEYFAYYTDDVVMHDQMMPADMTGLDAFKGMWESWSKGFSSFKMEPTTAFAAGDYVVHIGSMSGTNDGPMAAMGIKKATGKTVSMRGMGVIRMQDGKVAESWMFGNGMAMAQQLGLMPDKK